MMLSIASSSGGWFGRCRLQAICGTRPGAWTSFLGACAIMQSNRQDQAGEAIGTAIASPGVARVVDRISVAA
ncbi:hypothetical protein [Ramlibacter sp. Leaf400]|uniref:hypothetical protein n=1 Tax=Ramlibacter sp. Leaf400 TaxID=1736365 RepID=UPI0006FC34E8|nr:hypothetical protein [Ramlibacter sp. Leaf400]KQT10861.1 hypothetical protein ASG30_08620 [Ramlibacter sp. Leaf400]